MSEVLSLLGDHKYLLIVKGENGEGYFYCPLLLDGSETEEQAVSRFKDALCVVKHEAMVKYGRSCIMSGRIDGQPTPEFTDAHDKLMRDLHG